ncbi:putative metal dependent amidohydrolase [Triangularia verruculosa]|uniref:Metal dependent amidohydrolase n=1 Tax=Triangularia verruculosa TaxID=2587418 RepID=A0AAN6XDR7_9PEZI|nr:putative metal dependent amidohydrolase [Triangularia verruculosa]
MALSITRFLLGVAALGASTLLSLLLARHGPVRLAEMLVYQLPVDVVYVFDKYITSEVVGFVRSLTAAEKEEEGVFCYENLIRTSFAPDGEEGFGLGQGLIVGGERKEGNCLAVDRSTGLVTRVFMSSSSSETKGEKKRKGWVIPGLWDGHGHLLQYGEFLHGVDLFGAGTKGEVRERLKEYLRQQGDGEVGSEGNWIRGVGWDQGVLREGMPTADWLSDDEELKDKFFMLDRVDVHCTWVSQAVLNLLDLDSLPDEVPGGEIIRDPGMGVFCDNAMDYVTALWPKPTSTQKKKFVTSAMRELNKVGLVGMHDAGVLPTDIELYEEMVAEKKNDWTVRVNAMVECPERNAFCPEVARKVDLEGGWLRVMSVKLFADGALGSWGSAMIDPYSDRPTTSGSLLVNASTLHSLALSWAADAKFQVNIHAIGDLANRLAISALSAALDHPDVCPAGIPPDICQQLACRFRIEHAQIIHPDDQARMRELGIIPSIQPTHATSDMAYAEDRLGKERIEKEAYRMRSIWDVGPPVLGSDFPVEPPNPFEGVYAAVTRKNPRTGKGPEGWEGGWYRAQEGLSVEQAFDGFTRGPARAAFWEQQAGVIKEGAFADWVVMDEDVTSVREEDIRFLKVRETWVAGRRVYSRDDGKGEQVEEKAGGKEDL